jgi:hypothetical protein
MSSGFFLAKQRLSLVQSLRAYWLYLVPFILGPLICLAVKAALPVAAPAITAGYFLASAALAMWPLAFKDASNKYWLIGILAWFVLQLATTLAA